MFLKDLDTWPIFQLPDSFITKYPSFFEIRWRLHAPEAAICRRLFNCVASTLTMNGKNEYCCLVIKRLAFRLERSLYRCTNRGRGTHQSSLSPWFKCYERCYQWIRCAGSFIVNDLVVSQTF